MAHRIFLLFIILILISFKYKTIETNARTYLPLNISPSGSVTTGKHQIPNALRFKFKFKSQSQINIWDLNKKSIQLVLKSPCLGMSYYVNFFGALVAMNFI